MKEFVIRLSLLLKRQLANKIYICFLVAMPLCILLAYAIASGTKTSSVVPVGYYIEKQDENFSVVLRDSLKEISGKLEFVEYDDKQAMINDTSASTLECSYIFTEELFDGLIEDDYKNTVLSFTSPSTVVSDMVSEMVFTAIFRAFGDSVLYVYVDNNPEIFGELNNDELKAALYSAYNKQLDSGHTFSLDFKVYDSKAEASEDVIATVSYHKANSFSLPVHGIIAIFLLLCTLLACSDYCTESERGTFNTLSPDKKFILSACFMGSWLIPAVISSGIVLFISAFYGDINSNPNITSSMAIAFYELFAMLIYCILLMLFGLFLNHIIKKSLLISALIPVMIIGSLIFCPIIISLSAILPIARVVEKLFLPYYYLIFF